MTRIVSRRGEVSVSAASAVSRWLGADDLVRGEPVRKATAEFMAHYHCERNHQGLANALICPEPEHAGRGLY